MAVMACIETPVGAHRVALGLEAARGIYRELPVLLRPAFLDGASALPFLSEAHRFVFDQLGDGEAIMRLDEGEVLEREPAAPSARCHAVAQPSNLRMSRFDIGRKS